MATKPPTSIYLLMWLSHLKTAQPLAGDDHPSETHQVMCLTCLTVLFCPKMRHVYNHDQSRSRSKRRLAEAESVSTLHYLCFVSVSAFLPWMEDAITPLLYCCRPCIPKFQCCLSAADKNPSLNAKVTISNLVQH